jgi:hypothetical protein
MYVRTKRVRNTLYYYLVRSRRINGVPKQEVLKYLGKVMPSERQMKKIKKEVEDGGH